MIKGDSLESSYLYGVMLDRTGERVRMTLPTGIENKMICITPDYFSDFMGWARDSKVGETK
jgi:hypothetical protein